MKIQALLTLQQKDQNQKTLESSFGDAYLYQHNPIFQNIRNLVLSLQYTFHSPPSLEYQTLPFTQLENLLSARSIPYFDNVSVLKSLPQNLDWALVQNALKRNFIFHESCHAVARSQTLKLTRTNSDPKEVVFLRLLEESFANTLELLAVIFVRDAAHRYFYEVNSFTALFEYQKNFQRACAEFGYHPVFHAVLMGYIYSNFLKPHLSESDLGLILELAFEKGGNKKIIGAILKLTFQLDLDFKNKTTPLYFSLNGPQIDLKQVGIRDFLVKHQTLIKSLIQEALQNPAVQEHN